MRSAGSGVPFDMDGGDFHFTLFFFFCLAGGGAALLGRESERTGSVSALGISRLMRTAGRASRATHRVSLRIMPCRANDSSPPTNRTRCGCCTLGCGGVLRIGAITSRNPRCGERRTPGADRKLVITPLAIDSPRRLLRALGLEAHLWAQSRHRRA